jgi:hypothetical protein
MSEAVSLPEFNSPIVNHARKDFPLLYAGMTVEAALERIRREGVGERVLYFFATDAEGCLVGVLPTRRLLTAPLRTRLDEIMVRRVVAIPASATMLEAGDREEERPTVANLGDDVFEALVFGWRRFAAPLPGAFFVTAFPGCSQQSAPAQLARSWRAPLKRRSPAAWLWHFFSRWCSGSTRASACNQ